MMGQPSESAPQGDARVRSILLALAALVVVVALRAVFDATDDDALGWIGYVVQTALILALLWLCADRLLTLSRSGEEEGTGWRPSTRSMVIVLVIVLLGTPIIRVSGEGELNAVGLAIQIAALLGLLFLGARWIIQKIRGR